MTVLSPIRSASTSYGKLHGVLSVNFLTQTLSDAINGLRILKSGYCYLVDTNSSAVISHPQLSAKCNTIQCVEGLNDPGEYLAFKQLFLNPLHNKASSVTNKAIFYKKNGKTWMLTCALAIFGTVNYTVVVTVPKSEVDQASTSTTDSINRTVVNMIIIFSFVIVFFLIALVLFSRVMVISILDPVVI